LVRHEALHLCIAFRKKTLYCMFLCLSNWTIYWNKAQKDMPSARITTRPSSVARRWLTVVGAGKKQRWATCGHVRFIPRRHAHVYLKSILQKTCSSNASGPLTPTTQIELAARGGFDRRDEVVGSSMCWRDCCVVWLVAMLKITSYYNSWFADS